MFKPGFDLDRQRQARADAGKPEWFGEDDLYPDVRPALSALRELGVWVGIVGNQTVRAGGLLRGLDLPTDFIATSDDWGVAKPDVAFFDKVVEAAGCSAEQIIYVGDRIDNDITPAMRVGMRTAYIQRGPWGWIHKDRQDVKELSDWRILSLSELPDIVKAER
ncbi:HAD family hydrolase [Nocardia sp. PE-7]|uniref:HAD family hydrolase n=1 Tax=Nocardia sp. PE-7 TaxID=3058426 RepID=UPI0034626E47|nr:HAD family hydrolase [Nocardia sp. PE-7]